MVSSLAASLHLDGHHMYEQALKDESVVRIRATSFFGFFFAVPHRLLYHHVAGDDGRLVNGHRYKITFCEVTQQVSGSITTTASTETGSILFAAFSFSAQRQPRSHTRSAKDKRAYIDIHDKFWPTRR